MSHMTDQEIVEAQKQCEEDLRLIMDSIKGCEEIFVRLGTIAIELMSVNPADSLGIAAIAIEKLKLMSVNPADFLAIAAIAIEKLERLTRDV